MTAPLDQLIDEETLRRTNAVDGASSYGIMTAAFINGEFVCVTEYDITKEMRKALAAAEPDNNL